MILVWEEKELSIKAAHTGCGKCTLRLGVLDTKITLAVYAKDRRVPAVDKEMGRLAEDGLLMVLGIAKPRGRTHIPVREP